MRDDPDMPKKRIALTFDDGPNGLYTNRILDLLEQYDAKATFFVLGNMLKSNTKDEIARAISLGCEIGNHSFDHPSLTAATKEEILEQIRSTNEKIKEYSGTDYECRLYRPPYGNVNKSVMDTLYNDGLRMYAILWSSDSRDWEYRASYAKGEITRDEAIESAFRTVVSETSDGTIILMHDIQEITPDILALILEKYTSEGYEFVTVSELFDFEENAEKEAYYNRYRSTNSILPVY
jgi:peptidoglycan/xylan/chitin deacetylase (PgdA/CDA1 family)